MDRLVRERQQVVDRMQMADRRMDVDRLDRVAAEEMDRVEHLAEADEGLVVRPVADPSAVVEIGDVRSAGDGPERGPVAAHLEVAGGVPRMEDEARRRGADALGDE